MKPSHVRLVLDTATKHLFVALFDGETCFAEIYEHGDNDHSAMLMKAVSDLSSECGITAADIAEVIVGIGPGSYTGVRAGVVVAKVLAWTRSIPLKTVSSLALIASSATKPSRIVPYMDARRDNVFYGVYRLDDAGVLHLEQSDRFSSGNDIHEPAYADALILSEGRPDMQKIFTSTLLQTVDDIHRLTPHYLRKTEAERNTK